jgi:hypothetical protein
VAATKSAVQLRYRMVPILDSSGLKF